MQHRAFCWLYYCPTLNEWMGDWTLGIFVSAVSYAVRRCWLNNCRPFLTSLHQGSLGFLHKRIGGDTLKTSWLRSADTCAHSKLCHSSPVCYCHLASKTCCFVTCCLLTTQVGQNQFHLNCQRSCKKIKTCECYCQIHVPISMVHDTYTWNTAHFFLPNFICMWHSAKIITQQQTWRNAPAPGK